MVRATIESLRHQCSALASWSMYILLSCCMQHEIYACLTGLSRFPLKLSMQTMTMDLPANFIYNELDSLSLRLFKVHADATGRLNIQLHTLRMDDELPKYIALSYTWEPRVPMQTVSIKDSVTAGHLSISFNLWRLLIQMTSNQDSFYWADQICIDQQSTLELNHQVGLMSKMFHRANTVLIWLGDASNATDVAMKYISFKIAGASGRPNQNCTCRSVVEGAKTDESDQPCQYHFGSMLVEESLQQLLSRRYWSRVWIVQEIMFAQQILIKCGACTVSWKTFHDFYAWAFPSTRTPGRGMLAKSTFPASVRTLLDMKQDWGFGHQWRMATQELPDILRASKLFDSEMIVDRIFGLLGLVHIHQRLEVDYALARTQLFIKVLHALVKDPIEDEHIVFNFSWELWNALACQGSGMTCRQALIFAFPELMELYDADFYEKLYGDWEDPRFWTGKGYRDLTEPQRAERRKILHRPTTSRDEKRMKQTPRKAKRDGQYLVDDPY